MVQLRNVFFYLFLLVLPYLFPVALAADEHSFAQRFQVGANWKASKEWYLRGTTQTRYREGMSDFFMFLTDLGVEYRPAAFKRLRMPILYRFQDRENVEGWRSNHYVLIDPTLSLLRLGRWEIDCRPRLQLNIEEDFRLIYLRPLLRLNRGFRFHERAGRAWVYYDHYFTMQRRVRRASADPSEFSTGVSLPLSPRYDLLLYYMINSSRAKSSPDWIRIHQSCLALSFKL